MRWIYALALIGLLGCAAHKNSPQPISQPATLDELVVQARNYSGWLKSIAESWDGWISTGCDAVKFTGIWAASLEDPNAVPLEKAEASPGQWMRRNLAAGACYPDRSKSTISKDMLLGLTWWAWRAKRLDVMQQLVAYGEAHNWVMGDPIDRPQDVFVTPSEAGLFYQVIYRLGGEDNPARKIPDVYPEGLTGFQAELQVWNILLHGEISDTPGITDTALKRLHEHAQRQPNNPLFEVAVAHYTGDAGGARLLLSDETQWPSVHLPTRENHCQAWVVQRDDGSDWRPCDTGDAGDIDTLYGADFQVMVGILTGVKF